MGKFAKNLNLGKRVLPPSTPFGRFTASLSQGKCEFQ